ncbi:MAG TPA: ATP-binding protein [Steroidobacteraceae bacterium]|nr:ATP-binding protein [Steroidobacteraceae bacterium]HRX89297.1 ATP-binding protein [Steroidobacteraceae bacterium]
MKSLAGRLLAAIVGLLSVLLLANWLIGVLAARAFTDELSQNLSRSIAMYVAAEGDLIRAGVADQKLLARLARQAMVLNPAAEVYAIDRFGNVLWPQDPAVVAPGTRVGLSPLLQFLRGDAASGPIYGDDPRAPGRHRIFSAWEVRLGDQLEGYAYVMLGGVQHASLVGLVGQSYILKVALATTVVMLLLSMLAAWGLLRWLTQPLRELQARVQGVGQRLGVGSLGEPDVGNLDLGSIDRVVDSLARRVEQQLQALQTTDRMRRELFAHISHDLRTPLTAMRGYLETLSTQAEALSPARRAHFIEVVTRHSERLSRLVDQVFVLARLDAATLPIRPERLSVAELAQDVVAKWQLPAESASVRLQLEVDPLVPPITADIGLLETVFENLIDNAIRHSRPGGQTVVSVQRSGEDVAVSVRDDGAGIAASDLEAVQQAFVAGPGGRTGLGLAIVRRVLTLHGSKLCIRSVPEQGTEVSFRLRASDFTGREDLVTSAPAVSVASAALSRA